MASQERGADAADLPLAGRGGWREPVLVARLRRRPIAVIGFAVILVVLVCAVGSSLVAPYDPVKTNTDITFASPSAQHLLGTDNLGRDTFSRIVYGSRTALLVGVISALVGAALGVPLGIVAGYLGGRVDDVIMRTMDAFYAFPSLLLALAIITALGAGIGNVMLAIGITFVPVYARLIRGSTLSVKHSDFVLAAQAMGAVDVRVMLQHILPNVWAPVIVQMSLGIGYAIVAEAGLSFLGLGTKPPTPSWGSMLQLAQRYLTTHSTLALYPGMAIVIVVLAFNLVGDALRDELDPRLRGTT